MKPRHDWCGTNKKKPITWGSAFSFEEEIIRKKPDEWVLLLEVHRDPVFLLEIKTQGTKSDRSDGALFEFCNPSEFQGNLGWQPEKNACPTACCTSPFS